MKKVIIYHNPRCSKSRQALQLLVENNLEPKIIEYLKTPPEKNELLDLLNKFAKSPREILRKNESAYKELNLNQQHLTDDELITAILKCPILLERPIVVINNKAIIARPPEILLDWLK
jgi:arsenate reductase (glutaredoxin)